MTVPRKTDNKRKRKESADAAASPAAETPNQTHDVSPPVVVNGSTTDKSNNSGSFLSSFDPIVLHYVDLALADAKTSDPTLSKEELRENAITAMRLFLFPKKLIRYFESISLLDGTEAGSDAAVPIIADPPAKRRRTAAAGGSEPAPAANEVKSVQPTLNHPMIVPVPVDSVVCHGLDMQKILDGQRASIPPFPSDSAFVEGHEVKYVLRQWTSAVQDFNFSARMMAHFDKHGFDFVKHCIPCLTAVTHLYTLQLHVRLEKMQTVPRIFRVARLVGMEPHEVEALLYVLVVHCSTDLVFSTSMPLIPASVARHTRLTPAQLLHFIADHREYLRQGLIQFDVKMKTSMVDSSLTLPQEVVTALVGEELSEEQMIKLEKTSLAAVLDEEARAKQKRTSDEKKDTGASETPASVGPQFSIFASSPRLDKTMKKLMSDYLSGTAWATPKGSTGAPAAKQTTTTTTASSSKAPAAARSARNEDHSHDEDEHETDGSDGEEGNYLEVPGEVDGQAIDPAVLEKTLTEMLSEVDPSSMSQEDFHQQFEARIMAALGKTAPTGAAKKAAKETAAGEEPPVKTPMSTKGEPGSAFARAVADLEKEDAEEQLHGHAHGAGFSASDAVASSLLTNAPKRRTSTGSLNSAADAEHPSQSKDGAAQGHADPYAGIPLKHRPYDSDIEYVDEAFKILANLIRVRSAEGEMKDDEDSSFVPRTKVEATMRELKGKIRVASAVHRSRVDATRKRGSWLPRIERLADRLELTELAKQVMLLLVGNVVSHDLLVAINGRYVMRDGQRIMTVGYALFVLCDGLRERVAARSIFYQSSPLLSNGIITLSLEPSSGRTRFNTDLMDYPIDIDRKIVDYLMGTEMETAEMVPGSKLFFPSIPLTNVVLPPATTELVTTTIEHYSLFEQCKKRCGFGEGLGSGSSGLVILFYGPSGTGKTMLASALGNHLNKKLLLVNLVEFKSDARASDMLRFVFREAKLNDAIIFFDECESFFENRETNPLVTSILAEFETYDGLIMMATNKAQIIDEAMNRRISLMIEFKLPDHEMREKIWRAHIPKNLQLAEDVDMPSLALDYELSGGLIRNATLAAINSAVAREKTDSPTLQMSDFKHGARLQLRGLFQAAEKPPGVTSESYVTPKRSLADLVTDPQTKHRLELIAQTSKSRNTLFSQWGFKEEDCSDQGALYLFSGPSGTGKTFAAEAIAYECGATIRLCNISELLLLSELSVNNVFSEGRKLGAIIVFDQADILFDHSDRSQQVSQLIQYHTMKYPRPVIVLATTTATGSVDPRAARLSIVDHVVFQLPTRQLRKDLWRLSIPPKMPIAPDVNFEELSTTPTSAKIIRSVCFSACCRVALLPPKDRILTMKLLSDELDDALIKERQRNPPNSMFG